MTIWSAPVRYAEVDGQGVVFNAHYLLYCDEAMSLFCRERNLRDLAERVRLKTSTLTWTSGAEWGETLTVRPACTSVGRTSFAMSFVVESDARPCCQVDTTYVQTDHAGRPAPLAEHVRELLTR